MELHSSYFNIHLSSERHLITANLRQSDVRALTAVDPQGWKSEKKTKLMDCGLSIQKGTPTIQHFIIFRPYYTLCLKVLDISKLCVKQ